MTVASLLLFEGAAMIAGFVGLGYGFPEVAAAGFGLGAASLLGFAAFGTALARPLLVAYVALAGALSLLRVSPPVCTAVAAAAVAGWDVAATAATSAGAPPAVRRRFARAYGLRAAAWIAVTVGGVLVVGTLRWTPSFPIAVLLAAAALLIAALLLRRLPMRRRR